MSKLSNRKKDCLHFVLWFCERVNNDVPRVCLKEEVIFYFCISLELFVLIKSSLGSSLILRLLRRDWQFNLEDIKYFEFASISRVKGKVFQYFNLNFVADITTIASKLNHSFYTPLNFPLCFIRFFSSRKSMPSV